MRLGVVRKVTSGMMTNGTPGVLDEAGVGVVTGKVAWLAGRVYAKDVGVILCTGLIL